MVSSSVLHAVLVASWGGWIYGYNTGIIGGISASLTDYFFHDEIDTVKNSWQGAFTAEILFGAFIGAFAGVKICDSLGRKKAIAICGAVCLVCALLLGIAGSAFLIITARTVLGFSVGMSGCVCPLYVTEMVPPENRGKLGTIFQISICFTILVAQITNYAFNPSNEIMPDWKERLQFALGAIPGAIMLIHALTVLPESPKWHGYKGREGEGDVLDGAETGVDNSAAGPATKDESAGEEEIVGWANLFGPGKKWIIVCVILASANQLTGINAVVFYAPKIFEDAGMDNVLLLTILVVGTWNLLTVFISFVLVDKLGRRPLMLGSLFAMAFGCSLLALAYVAFPDAKTVPAILAVMIYIMAFECGPGPLFFLMASETFPTACLNEALSLSNCIAWVFNIAVSFLFPTINGALGAAATFLLFTGTALLTATGVYFKLPETKYVAGKDGGDLKEKLLAEA